MILLVTKNNNLAKSFRNDLNQEGFEVELFNWKQDLLLSLYQRNDFDMLILDLESTDVTTSDLFQKIKAHPTLSHIPLICIIKKDLVLEQLIAFELGADEFIFIPYTTPELQLRMRSIQGLLNLQKQLREKESRLNSIKQTQKILVTLNHYINNSLTPLYSLLQVMDESKPEDARRLKEFSHKTVDFIRRVLITLNNLVQNGEIKAVKQGVYRDLMLDIENELKKLQQSSQN